MKIPPEFLECVGYRVLVDDSEDLRIRPREGRNPLTEVSLASIWGKHGGGHIVCSDCAHKSYINESICLWNHERMIPLCRDCSENPPRAIWTAIGNRIESKWTIDSPDVPRVFENIRNFSQSMPYFECNCFEMYSPANGYHLCTRCAGALSYSQVEKLRLIRDKGLEIDDVYDPRHYVIDGGRNTCPCGKLWDDLKSSWEGFTQEKRDQKMYRMCMLCTGHVPRKDIKTEDPTWCL